MSSPALEQCAIGNYIKVFRKVGLNQREFAVQHAFFHLFYSHYMDEEGILSSTQKRQTEAQSVNDGELQCRAYETSGLLTLLIITKSLMLLGLEEPEKSWLPC